MLAHLPEVGPGEPIELEFTGVLVVAPSWLDDVLHGLNQRFGDRVRCLPSDNRSLVKSLAVLSEAT